MKIKSITECGRDYMPDEGGMVAGWLRQGIPTEQYVSECIAYGKQLSVDGVFGTLYTLGALDNPQSPINQAPFNVDSIVRQLLDAHILDTNLGPHLHATNGDDVKHWIRNARVVKALDNVYPLTIANDQAIRYFRVTMDDLNASSNAHEIASRLVNKLEGYRHDLLYCEGLVGVSPQDVVAHSKQLRNLQAELALLGIKIAGPSWYDGNGDATMMDNFMFCDSVAAQCYWANKGFTEWHALRYQKIFKNLGEENPVPMPTPTQIYPKALWTPLTNNFTVGGAMPKIIVVHGTSGLGDPFGYWNNPATGASADFWLPRAGPKVKQYVKLGDTSWSNGPLAKPDLSVPFLKWLVEYQKTHPGITGNHYCVSLEFEKAPGNKSGLTAWQIREGRELIKWLSDENAIPLDRNHVLGHYQFDSVNRPFCPGPIPWDDLLSNYPELAERNYWGPMWSAINWARMKGRVTQEQQVAIHKMINADKAAAGVS